MKIYPINNTTFCSNKNKKGTDSKINFKDAAIATTLLGFVCKNTNYEELITKCRTQPESLPKTIANWIYILGMGGLLITFINDINNKWLKDI